MANIKLHLIVPLFSQSIELEKQRRNNWNEWFSSEKTQDAFKEYGVEEIFQHTPSVGYTLEDPVKTVTYNKIQKKGRVIADKISSIDRTPGDFVVCIDGDGQIDFNYILRIVNLLKQGEKIVFSCRKKDFGIDGDDDKKPRENIERFELFLISEIFNIGLPDGQCGCWGFNSDIVNDIGIPTASGFEIELDLLMLSLLSKYEICFLPINVMPEKTTTFHKQVHEDKLRFLMRKLKLTNEVLRSLLDKYLHVNRQSLVKEYLDILSSLGIVMMGKKMPKCVQTCQDTKSFSNYHPCHDRIV